MAISPGLIARPPAKSPLATAAAGGTPTGSVDLSQYSPAMINQLVARYTATLPKPLTDAQQQAQARGELSQVLGPVASSIQGQAQRAGQAISGYSDSLAKALASTDYAAPYTRAEGSQAAVDASLASALAGGGTQAASELRSSLASLNEPGVVDAAANAVQATGTGNANANLAGGSAALSDLIANAAAAGEYGAKQPGLAKLAGLQGIEQANQSAQSQLATQTAQVETQLPTILNDLRSQSDTRAADIGNLGAKVQSTLVGANSAGAKDAIALGLGELAAGNKTTAEQDLAAYRGQLLGVDRGKLSVAQQNADTASARASIASGKAQAAGTPKFNASASRALGYRSDQYGNPVGSKITPLPGFTFGANGNITKTPTGAAATKTHGFTAPQVAKLQGDALTVAQNAALGIKPGAGGSAAWNKAHPQGLPQVSRDQALTEMEQSGIPDWVAIPALNKFYGTPGAQNAATKFFGSTSLGF